MAIDICKKKKVFSNVVKVFAKCKDFAGCANKYISIVSNLADTICKEKNTTVKSNESACIGVIFLFD